MQTTTGLTTDIARNILANASQIGLPIEVYLRKIIEKDDRLTVMAEAMNDDLFLADFEEMAGAFKYVDF